MQQGEGLGNRRNCITSCNACALRHLHSAIPVSTGVALLLQQQGISRLGQYIMHDAAAAPPALSCPACCLVTAADTEKVDGRAVRRSLNATGRYVRQPTKDEKSQALMEEHGGCAGTAVASADCNKCMWPHMLQQRLPPQLREAARSGKQHHWRQDCSDCCCWTP